jgi:hypothetical protein
MKTFIKIKNNNKVFLAKSVLKDNRLWVHIFRNAEKMPVCGTNFNENTSPLVVQSWVTENVGKLQA